MRDDLQPLMADAATRRALIRTKTLEGLKSVFPIIGRNVTIEAKGFDVRAKEYSSAEQKDALMRGRTLHEPVVGTLTLRDNKTAKVIDEKKNHTLLHLPYFTERHTFIIGGNEYDVPNQLRLKPGVYTRERGNGEFEAAFNLSKGDNFRIAMEPESGKLHMELGTSRIPLYPLLRSLGVPDNDIRKYWGAELRDMNAAAAGEKEEQILNKIIAKIKRTSDSVPSTIEGKRDFVRDYFDRTEMNAEVTERTLGVPLGKANATALLTASKKLIDVHKGEAEEDDRDSLEFKTLHSVDDFFKERLDKDAKRTVARKLQMKLNQSSTPTIDRVVPNSAFTKSINSFLTSSSLSSIPMQINPVEIIDHASRVTSLGEGGISSERAIPFESRKMHNTHLGILDPVRTPEGFKAGIDIRASLAAHRDKEGNLYTLLRNLKTGKVEHVPATKVAKSAVAFPHQDPKHTHLDCVRGTDVVSLPRAQVEYEIPDATYMFGATTAMVPLINGMQGNRAIMGSKFQTQALPLIEREAPLVQAQAPRKNQSMEREVARLVVPTSRVDGTVAKIDDGYIYIRPDGPKTAAEDLVKVPYDTFFPLASKTYLHNELKVKVGDKVKKDEPMAESNFTKDGHMALGKNLTVGYMAYYGKNSNDAVVISEGAAKKLTSEHMYKEVLQKGNDIILGKDKYGAYFGMRFTKEQMDKLDANGVVKPGVVLKYGDPIILGLRKAAPTPEAALLGNLHKSLVKPYADTTVTWDKPVDAHVQDAVDSARQIMVTVRTFEPMKVGDKLANRFGGKGVISEIVSNEKMIKAEDGEPIDVLFTSAGVVSRINPAQIVEAALGKVAAKTGKPIILPQFMPEDNVQYAKRMLAEHGVKDKETVYDPVSDKYIPNIFVGKSYIHKLFKNTETNYAARGVSDYDINLQPTRGGDEGAKGLGKMEINALLAHNARNVLKEGLTLKSEKSDDFWRAFEFGLPPPPPKTPFVADKFISMLKGAGINVDKRGTEILLGPLTDPEVGKLSSGALAVPSLEKSKSFMVSAKNMKPERGGLFDPVLTGGLSGTRWAHMELSEPIVNPVFEEPVRRLLGMTK
jgi:DNA-directed RNA polymerase beta subunit